MYRSFVPILILIFLLVFFLNSCSSLIPEKIQNISSPHNNAKDSDDKMVNKDRMLNGKSPGNLGSTPENANAGHPNLSSAGNSNVNPDIDMLRPLEKEVLETHQLCGPDPLTFSNSTEHPFSDHKAEPSPEVKFEFEICDSEIMLDYLDYYTRKHHKTFQRWLNRAEPYLPYIREIFSQKGLPHDLIFLPFAESGFNPWAYSSAGAAGLWQFMPATGRNCGLTVDWWVDERRDPYAATVAAAEHLKELYEQFGDWHLVLAAYNAGKGRVIRAVERSSQDDYFQLVRNSRYFSRETKYYVPKFLAILQIVRNLKKYGFEELQWDAPAQPSKIKAPGGTNLLALCRRIDMDWSQFRHRNPAFRRATSPPDRKCFVYLPSDKIQTAKRFVNSSESRKFAGLQRYRIRQGDSWWRLSRRFNVPVHILKDLNQRRSNLIRPGQWVIIPAGAGDYLAAGNPQRTLDGQTYTVRTGDTLWEIANMFDIPLRELKKANGIHGRDSLLKPGQKLAVPQDSSLARTRKIAKRRANYQVKRGDTLWDISQRYGTSVQTLLQANGLRSAYSLQVGAKLYIPDISSKMTEQTRRRASKVHKKLVQYRVREGDNLWSIARRFGVSTRDLLSWNDLSQQTLIHPGDKLKIYID